MVIPMVCETLIPSTPLTPVQSGKVYKGLWRGTTVAVKLVVLTNNMSGAEKVSGFSGNLVPLVLFWLHC